MKWVKVTSIVIAVYNLFASLVFSTLGGYETEGLVERDWLWIFYLFPSPILLVSGALSLLSIIGMVVFILVKRRSLFIGTLSIAINIWYIYFYMNLLAMQ